MNSLNYNVGSLYLELGQFWFGSGSSVLMRIPTARGKTYKCFDCRLDYYRCHDDHVSASLKSGLVLLSDSKKMFKLQNDNSVGLNIVHQTYNHQYHNTITYHNSHDVVNKAMNLYGGFLVLFSISKTVKQAITRSILLQIHNISIHDKHKHARRIHELFSSVGTENKIIINGMTTTVVCVYGRITPMKTSLATNIKCTHF